MLDYAGAGVDFEREDLALLGLRQWLDKTHQFRSGGMGTPVMEIGSFANVLDLGAGSGLAISTDGVGTKILVARMMNKYDTIGIDCVAMNVNDIICIGAEPIALVDYLAVQEPCPELIEQIAKGLHDGARMARISIPGGEIAQLPEMLADEFQGMAFDLAGTAVGIVSLDRIISGSDIDEHDVIIGLRSSGIHSNGLTLARKALFEAGELSVDTFLPELSRTAGEELLEPTTIYVPHIIQMLNSDIRIKALVNITGGGFLNLARVKAEVGFVIEYLPEPHPIFSVIQGSGHIVDEEMFRVYNMGIGFCIITPEQDVDKVIKIAMQYGTEGYQIGHIIRDTERKVFIKPKGLVSKGSSFFRI